MAELVIPQGSALHLAYAALTVSHSENRGRPFSGVQRGHRWFPFFLLYVAVQYSSKKFFESSLYSYRSNALRSRQRNVVRQSTTGLKQPRKVSAWRCTTTQPAARCSVQLLLQPQHCCLTVYFSYDDGQHVVYRTLSLIRPWSIYKEQHQYFSLYMLACTMSFTKRGSDSRVNRHRALVKTSSDEVASAVSFGPLLARLSRSELSCQPNPVTAASIVQVETVASFNWLEERDAHIAVPGLW